jgi:hypothetical protein
MPRMPAKIRRRYREGLEILDSEVEESFLRGEGLLGTPPELRTLEDWHTQWARWRDVVMPKAIEHQPGLRPFACYVCGEIEPPPLLRPVPLTARFFKLYIVSTRGDGQWHHRYPEPYQRDETLHLRDLGVVDDAELKRHRAWRRDGMPFTYVFEQGSYE